MPFFLKKKMTAERFFAHLDKVSVCFSIDYANNLYADAAFEDGRVKPLTKRQKKVADWCVEVSSDCDNQAVRAISNTIFRREAIPVELLNEAESYILNVVCEGN